jgi:hypothetical protein
VLTSIDRPVDVAVRLGDRDQHLAGGIGDGVHVGDGPAREHLRVHRVKRLAAVVGPEQRGFGTALGHEHPLGGLRSIDGHREDDQRIPVIAQRRVARAAIVRTPETSLVRAHVEDVRVRGVDGATRFTSVEASIATISSSTANTSAASRSNVRAHTSLPVWASTR